MGLYLAVTVASWLATRLPLGLLYPIADLAGSASYRLSRGARSAICANLSVVLDHPPSSPAVHRTAKQAFRTNARNWIDSLRLAVTTRDEVFRRVRVPDWNLVAESVELGKGLLLVGAHLGNIDMVGQLIAAHGLRMTIPVEPMRPPALFERTQRLRESMGIRLVPAASSARQLLRTLRAGEIVGIMADRNLEETGVEVEFFGRRTTVSRGPAWLATHCNAPVLLGIGLRSGGDADYDGFVRQLEIRRTGDTDADERSNAQTIMTAIEERIRRNPEQWCMFVPLWSENATRGLQ